MIDKLTRYDSGDEIDPGMLPCEEGDWVNYNEVKELEASCERLKARTWEQEREAILAYIRLCKIVVGGKTAERLEILAKDIECGEHWQMKENQNDR